MTSLIPQHQTCGVFYYEVTLQMQSSFVYIYEHESKALTFALCSVTTLLRLQSTVAHFLPEGRRSCHAGLEEHNKENTAFCLFAGCHYIATF